MTTTTARATTWRMLAVLLPLLCANWAQAQYENEWINYNQTYYKIRVATNGLYRIPYSVLQSAGLPTTNVSQLALYAQGQQQALYVSSGDGAMGSSDFVEFYGQRNDATLDIRLFANPADQLNTTKSLFSDTATYYLTAQSGTNLRYQATANDLSNPPAAEPYFIHTSSTVFANVFSGGETFFAGGRQNAYAQFGKNEGSLGLDILGTSNQSFTLNTAFAATSAPVTAQVRCKVVGKNNDASINPDHHVTVQIGANQYANVSYDGFDAYTFNFAVPLDQLGATQTAVTVASVQDLAPIDNNAPVLLQISYPRLFNLGNQRTFALNLANNDEKLLTLENFNADSAPVLYDFTNRLRLLPTLQNGKWAVRLPATNVVGERRLWVSNTTSPLAIQTLAALSAINFTNYANGAQQGSYILITPPSLLAAAEQYAQYRRSSAGGGFEVVVVNVEQLYDQFAWGIAKHPLAIRHFINYARDTWGIAPQYLLLLGAGKIYTEFAVFNNYARCLVPTYGTPPSDVLLAARHPNTDLPQLAVGRIPATTPEEVLSYLSKIQQYEATRDDLNCDTDNIWRKKIIAIAQNDQNADLNADTGYLSTYQSALENGAYGMVSRAQYRLLATQNPTDLNTQLTDGAGICMYAGGSNAGYWKFNVGQATDYDNTNGRYPLVLSSASFVGNIHSSTPTMANDYVLADNAGVIGFADNSTARFAATNATFTQQLLQNLQNTNYLQGIGAAITTTLQDLYVATPPINDSLRLQKLVCQTYTLAADPALNPAPRLRPEYAIPADNAVYYNPLSHFPILSTPPYISPIMPYFEAHLQVVNLGKAIADSANLQVSRFTQGFNLVELFTQRIALPAYIDTVVVQVPNDLSGEDGSNTFYFFIDADNEITEGCEANNSTAQNFEVYAYNGISELQAAQMQLYPNPATQQLYLSHYPSSVQGTQLAVYNALGVQVMAATLQAHQTALDVSALPSGIYWCKLGNTARQIAIVR